MSMPEDYADEMAEERWLRTLAKRHCSECGRGGGEHNSGCPNIEDAPEEEVEEVEEVDEDDTEESAA